MKILKWILGIFAGLVALVLIVALFLPGELKIESKTEINLPARKIYYSLSTFSDHASWNPWMVQDTTAKLSVSLKEGVIGSGYTWTSKHSGGGQLVIDSVMPDKYISYTLAFDGMDQKAWVWNNIDENAGKTIVSWGFQQKAPYPLGRIILTMMKSRLLKDYDSGLANLKKLLEEKGVIMSTLSPILVEKIPGFNAIVIEGKCPMNEISLRMGEMFQMLGATIQAQGLQISGTPFTHYVNFDASTGMSTFDVGYPVAKPGKSTKVAKAVFVKEFSALEAIHQGPYDEFGISYSKFMKYIKENKVNTLMTAWEFYLTDPVAVPDEMQWKTLIAFPLKD